MDEQVLRAMARWPEVPAVHGWLRLGRRGTWFLIDRGAPGFDAVRDGDGSPITSPPIRDFIARNYESDADGAWYWQNGPQRVFVRLDLAPWVLRVIGDGDRRRFCTHTGRLIASVAAIVSDPEGNLFAQTDAGCGLVDDRDLAQLGLSDDAEGVQVVMPAYPPGRWRIESEPSVDAIARRFGFLRDPVPPATGR